MAALPPRVKPGLVADHLQVRANHPGATGVKPRLEPACASGCASGLKQPDAGLTVDDDLKHRRATLHLGLLISGDKSCGRGRTHVRQVEIFGHAAKTPRVRVP